MATKICRDCQQEKPLSEFGKYAPSPDGLWNRCKPCCRIRDRKARERTKAKNQDLDPYALVDGQVRTKACLACKETHPVTDFHRSIAEPDGLSYLCKTCSTANAQRVRDRNRKKHQDAVAQVGLKQCSVCERELPGREFHRDRNSTDGLDCACKECVREQSRTLREKNTANYEPRTEGTKVCTRCKAEKPVTAFNVLRSTKDGLRYSCRECDSAAYWDLRVEVLTHYCGGKAPHCECCGENRLEFMTIEHVNKDGGQHRKEFGNYPIFRWLKKHRFPSGITVLCANCNMSRGHYGYCPCGRYKKRQEQSETQ